MKKYTIKNGEIVQTTFGEYYIQAKNKSEAQKLFNSQLENIRNAPPPTVKIKNQAILLVYHNGSNFVSCAGKMNPARFISFGGHKTFNEAINCPDLDYYAENP